MRCTTLICFRFSCFSKSMIPFRRRGRLRRDWDSSSERWTTLQAKQTCRGWQHQQWFVISLCVCVSVSLSACLSVCLSLSLSLGVPVVFFGTHSLTLLDYHQALKLKSRYMSYIMRWLVGIACLVIVTRLKRFTCLPFITHLPTKCLLVDFIAPCIPLHFCLSHILFDVWTSFIPCVYWCVED